MFMSNNEESLLAVLRKLAGQVIPEVSPLGESQANGAAEENGKVPLGLAMTMLEQVCSKVGGIISGNAPFVQRMIRRAAMGDIEVFDSI